ncbi:MAG: diguanylate cyclase [Proteobacteria bacterium]|nr:diguanylate cyclase [Pseudomonadota bacterium]MBU1389042.1 diguanylate cyclase [Pseudomonadota bacterium]MBU1543594.1 diguanylate cyclase [Pseudomonadota bacterium]MBU2481945.1 diguanylate cyclase [Pseudomonadota bacterium]
MENDSPSHLKTDILIVDAVPENLTALKQILKKKGTRFITAKSGKDALKKVKNHDFALILLNTQMPDMDGYETAERLRKNQDTRHIPIIFIAAAPETDQDIFKGYESGAVDYLLKPVDKNIIQSKVNVFTELYHQKKLIQDQNAQLRKSNKEILRRQHAFIEQERLKVVLQLAGAAVHDFNHPLMELLESITQIEADGTRFKDPKEQIEKIKKAGRKISEIIENIEILNYKTPNNETVQGPLLQAYQNVRILYVEDNEVAFKTVSIILKNESSISVYREKTVESALKLLLAEKFDMLLLDYDLPDGTGLDLLRATHQLKISTPAVFITGQGDEIIASNAIREGAYDYLTKSQINRDTLLGSIQNTLEKFRLKQTVDKAFEKITIMSTRDALTGLYNRQYMDDLLSKEFNRARRYKTQLSCLLFDLDYFKKINDTYGHACGDQILKEVAALLSKNRRESDSVFRYGGEEFFMLLPHTDIQGASVVAENLRKNCESEIFTYGKHQIYVTISTGIASMQVSEPESATEFIVQADTALYQAKKNGRNCFCLYAESSG